MPTLDLILNQFFKIFNVYLGLDYIVQLFSCLFSYLRSDAEICKICSLILYGVYYGVRRPLFNHPLSTA